MDGQSWRFLKCALVIDKTFVETIGQNNTKDTKKIVAGLVNHVTKVFKSLKIRFALVSMETLAANSTLNVTHSASENLRRFKKYKLDVLLRERKGEHDTALLLTNKELNGLAGLANVGGLCTESSVSVVKWTGNIEMTASVISHEIGHNFGFLHTGRGCNCDNGPCAMDSMISTPANEFSECIQEDFIGYVEESRFRCLMSIPLRTVTDAICGNGLVEDSEECDCGDKEECKDTCCDVEACKLKENAECSSGECCEDCKLRKKGSLCREVEEECDLVDFCDGKSEQCPNNSYKEDYTLCNDGRSYCLHGSCALSYDNQCKVFWGTNALKGHDICYKNLNVRGDTFGNCGTNDEENYIKCQTEDTLCGYLQCTGENLPIFPIIGSNRKASMFSFSSGDTTITCRAGSTYLGYDVKDATLVASGTKCGEGKVCHETRCVNVTTLQPSKCVEKCPPDKICSNEGKCRCIYSLDNVTCSDVPLKQKTVTEKIEDDASNSALVGILVAMAIILFVLVAIIFFKRKALMSFFWRRKLSCASSTIAVLADTNNNNNNNNNNNSQSTSTIVDIDQSYTLFNRKSSLLSNGQQNIVAIVAGDKLTSQKQRKISFASRLFLEFGSVGSSFLSPSKSTEAVNRVGKVEEKIDEEFTIGPDTLSQQKKVHCDSLSDTENAAENPNDENTSTTVKVGENRISSIPGDECLLVIDEDNDPILVKESSVNIGFSQGRLQYVGTNEEVTNIYGLEMDSKHPNKLTPIKKSSKPKKKKSSSKTKIYLTEKKGSLVETEKPGETGIVQKDELDESQRNDISDASNDDGTDDNDEVFQIPTTIFGPGEETGREGSISIKIPTKKPRKRGETVSDTKLEVQTNIAAHRLRPRSKTTIESAPRKASKATKPASNLTNRRRSTIQPPLLTDNHQNVGNLKQIKISPRKTSTAKPQSFDQQSTKQKSRKIRQVSPSGYQPSNSPSRARSKTISSLGSMKQSPRMRSATETDSTEPMRANIRPRRKVAFTSSYSRDNTILVKVATISEEAVFINDSTTSNSKVNSLLVKSATTKKRSSTIVIDEEDVDLNLFSRHRKPSSNNPTDKANIRKISTVYKGKT